MAAGREKCQGIPQRAVPRGAVLAREEKGWSLGSSDTVGLLGTPPRCSESTETKSKEKTFSPFL